MPSSKQDRDDINLIHGIPNTRSMSNDASNTSRDGDTSGRWKKNATPIHIPGNERGVSSSGNGWITRNPYNRVGAPGTAARPKKRTPLNMTTKAQESAIRQVREVRPPQPISSRDVPSRFFLNSASQPSDGAGPSAMKADSDDEVMELANPWWNGKQRGSGQQRNVSVELDRLKETLARSDGSQPDINAIEDEGNESPDASSDPIDLFGEDKLSPRPSLQMARDGESTLRLKEKHPGSGVEIQIIPSGNTRLRASNFSSGHPPKAGPSKVSQMKRDGEKRPQTQRTLDQSLNSKANSNKQGGGRPSRPRTTAFSQPLVLPLHAWIFAGKVHYPSDDEDRAHWALLDVKTNVLSVSHRINSAPTCQFRLDRQSGLTYSDQVPDYPIIIIKSAMPMRGNDVAKSKRISIPLVLRFNKYHNSWKDSVDYISLVDKLKEAIGHSETVKGNGAANGAWGQYERDLTGELHDAPRAAASEDDHRPTRNKRKKRRDETVKLADVDDVPIKSHESPRSPARVLPWAEDAKKPPGPKPRPKFKSTDLNEFEGLRRSARHSALTRIPSPEPTVGNDETILVYPPVTLTNGDLRRLEPSQFLNDKIIEFALKLWHNGLRECNPELADQVHVFNSFLYKKLDVKNPADAYSSVRKWTAKFDLFQKKYLIIPINEHAHWYLAVVYQPEHVLLPPLDAPIISSPTVTTRRQARLSEATQAAVERSPSPISTTHEGTGSGAAEIEHAHSPANAAQAPSNLSDSDAEMEVEQALHSCSITEDPDEMDVAPDKPARPGLMECDPVPASSPPAELEYIDSPETSYPAALGYSRSPSPELGDPKPDPRPESPVDVTYDKELAAGSLKAKRDTSEAVPPKTFYEQAFSKARRIKRRRSGSDDDDNATLDGDPALSDHSESSHAQQTWIFTLDSLNNRHKRAENVLTSWLQAEASDKKKVEQSRKPRAKMASMPMQPNFCDCGLYLIHFVNVFMKDPEHYANLILTWKAMKRSDQTNAREREWRGAEVPSMRDELMDTINSMSEQWLKEKEVQTEHENKGKEAADGGMPHSDSDDDVQILDSQGLPSPKKRPAKRARVSQDHATEAPERLRC